MELDQDRQLAFNDLPSPAAPRIRSPLRMKYDAEIMVFRSKYGGLEDVRQSLGISRRKLCQLLMVDPSAWTRWVKDEARVPPHIYRLLEFYIKANQPGPQGVPLNIELQWTQLTKDYALMRDELMRQRQFNLYIGVALALCLLSLVAVILT